MYQEDGSGPTGLKYSRKLNRLDDIVLFTVADKEPSSSASLSFSAFPTVFLFLSALLLELLPSPAAEDTDRLHMERRDLSGMLWSIFHSTIRDPVFWK